MSLDLFFFLSKRMKRVHKIYSKLNCICVLLKVSLILSLDCRGIKFDFGKNLQFFFCKKGDKSHSYQVEKVSDTKESEIASCYFACKISRITLRLSPLCKRLCKCRYEMDWIKCVFIYSFFFFFFGKVLEFWFIIMGALIFYIFNEWHVYVTWWRGEREK